LARGQRGRLVRVLRGVGIVAAVVLCSGSECRRQTFSNNYEALTGVVLNVRTDTSELTVRPVEPAPERADAAGLLCLLTNDAEVYINDRYASVNAIAVNDAVELVGYREENARGERFVVCLAQITRPAAAPVEPDLSPRATTATQPQEN
jgi:hypothetical protein